MQRAARTRKQSSNPWRPKPWAGISVILCVFLAMGTVSAQAADDGQSDPAAPQTFTVSVKPIAAFGVAGGLPGYQAGTALASVQYRFAGMALRAGYGTAGLQASVDVRGYPPIPVPVPIYGAVGVNLYGEGVGYHAALGAHLPLSLQWRLDVEAGVAFAAFGDQRAIAPHVIVGVSYALPFDPELLGTGRADSDAPVVTEAEASPGGACEPSGAGIDAAVADVVRDFLEDAQAGYGSVYEDLQYTYAITDTSVAGERAMVQVDYSGSVREIATGDRVAADGQATVSLSWQDCAWTSAGVDY